METSTAVRRATAIVLLAAAGVLLLALVVLSADDAWTRLTGGD